MINDILLFLTNIYFVWRRVPELVAAEKSYSSCMVSNKDTMHMKIIALDEIYKFVVFEFCHLRLLKWSKY